MNNAQAADLNSMTALQASVLLKLSDEWTETKVEGDLNGPENATLYNMILLMVQSGWAYTHPGHGFKWLMLSPEGVRLKQLCWDQLVEG